MWCATRWGTGSNPPPTASAPASPPTGCVTLEARREGNTLVIVVRDDGKGLDDEAIAAKARQLGWLGPDEKPSRERLQAFLFQPGFSTRSQANAISGRGVGMDVVAREVEQLRGTVDLASQPGRGTRLTLRLPARLALEPALIVRVGRPALRDPGIAGRTCPAVRTSGPEPRRDSRGVGRPILLRIPPRAMSVTYRDQAIPVVFAREMLGIGRSVLGCVA